MEQIAYSDQDNAMILARPPSHTEVRYVARWARFVCDGLATAGYLGPTPALAPDDALDLTVALEHLGYHRLQHQRRQLDRGESPTTISIPTS